MENILKWTLWTSIFSKSHFDLRSFYSHHNPYLCYRQVTCVSQQNMKLGSRPRREVEPPMRLSWKLEQGVFLYDLFEE
jgi:hypothetical protein